VGLGLPVIREGLSLYTLKQDLERSVNR